MRSNFVRSFVFGSALAPLLFISEGSKTAAAPSFSRGEISLDSLHEPKKKAPEPKEEEPRREKQDWRETIPYTEKSVIEEIEEKHSGLYKAQDWFLEQFKDRYFPSYTDHRLKPTVQACLSDFIDELNCDDSYQSSTTLDRVRSTELNAISFWILSAYKKGQLSKEDTAFLLSNPKAVLGELKYLCVFAPMDIVVQERIIEKLTEEDALRYRDEIKQIRKNLQTLDERVRKILEGTKLNQRFVDGVKIRLTLPH